MIRQILSVPLAVGEELTIQKQRIGMGKNEFALLPVPTGTNWKDSMSHGSWRVFCKKTQLISMALWTFTLR